MLDFLQRFFGVGSQGDSIATVYLEEALRQAGCPICRLIAKAERHYFEAFFYENVNDPGVNDELRASRGFCTEHTRTVFALDSGNQSPSGVASFFVRFMDDLLRHAGSDTRLLGWLR